MKIIWCRKQRIFLCVFLFICSILFPAEGKVIFYKDPIPETREQRLEIADKAIKYIHQAAHSGLLSPFSPKRLLYRFEWPEAFLRAYPLHWDPQYINFREAFRRLFWRCDHPDYNCVSVKDIPIVRSILDLGWEDIQNRFYILYQEQRHSNNPYYWAEKGLIALDRGDVIDSINCIHKILDNEKMEEYLQNIKEDSSYLHIELAKSYLETNQFSQALDTLNKAIKKDPNNKEAYFQRAIAYFELGNFDESLQDYITSKIEPTSIPKNSNLLDFSLGVSEGIIKGGAEAAIEYIPSLISSMYGLGQGLWAFAQDPINISYELVQATQDCIEFVRTHTPKEYLGKLVPELQYLIENWDMLDGKEKGVLSGHIIGKYGVDIFAGMAAKKGLRYYQNLKKANSIMTYEAMKFSEANQQLIKTKAKECIAIRKEMIKRGAFKLEIDKQTKHIPGSWNYQVKANRSIWTDPDPQKKISRFGGKGIRVTGKLGQPGYKEIVDCKEVIGFCVDKNTGVQIPTTRATIHYSKKGAHIVPAPPK